MRFARITRVDPASGGVDRPWRSRDHYYELAPVDPMTGAIDLQHPRRVDNYGEALELVEQGWAIRMGDGKAPAALVPPRHLRLSDEPYEFLDELWTYTMPSAPFPREALLADLQEFLIHHAAAIRMIAGRSAAVAFIGAGSPGREQFQLGGFRLTGLVMAAYDSAFRTGGDRPLNDDDIACIEYLLDMILRPRRHRAVSSGAGEYASLRHTIRCAWLRWKIAQGTLDDCELDLPLAESLGAMAGLSYQASRNAMAREKLSTLKGAPSCDDVAAWLERRRDFHPLRACERPGMPATRAALDLFASRPLNKALTEIRRLSSSLPPCPPDSSDLDGLILRASEGAGVPSTMLRDYARAHRLCIDSFVANFPQTQHTDADHGLTSIKIAGSHGTVRPNIAAGLEF